MTVDATRGRKFVTKLFDSISTHGSSMVSKVIIKSLLIADLIQSNELRFVGKRRIGAERKDVGLNEPINLQDVFDMVGQPS